MRRGSVGKARSRRRRRTRARRRQRARSLEPLSLACASSLREKNPTCKPSPSGRAFEVRRERSIFSAGASSESGRGGDSARVAGARSSQRLSGAHRATRSRAITFALSRISGRLPTSSKGRAGRASRACDSLGEEVELRSGPEAVRRLGNDALIVLRRSRVKPGACRADPAGSACRGRKLQGVQRSRGAFGPLRALILLLSVPAHEDERRYYMKCRSELTEPYKDKVRALEPRERSSSARLLLLLLLLRTAPRSGTPRRWRLVPPCSPRSRAPCRVQRRPTS